MRRMYSENQLIELSQEQINALAVRKMKAPTSDTLTNEELEIIIDGVFIEGNFLDLVNPILLPPIETSTAYVGCIIGASSGSSKMVFTTYAITKATKIIGSPTSANYLSLNKVDSFNGKTIPDYPSATGTFTLKYVNGVLTWVED